MSDSDPKQASTRAAVYVFLKRGNQTAMILRSNTGYRDGEWAMPSGKVDHGEPFTVSAIREAKEEVGIDIDIKDLQYVLTLHRKSDNNPANAWVDVLFVCESWKGEPYNAEPHKHSALKWFDMDDLPSEVMDYQRALMQAYKNKTPYVEFGWKEDDYDPR